MWTFSKENEGSILIRQTELLLKVVDFVSCLVTLNGKSVSGEKKEEKKIFPTFQLAL